MPTWNGPSPDGPTGPVATGRMLPGYVNFEEQVLDMDTYLDKMLTERRRPVDVTQEQIASGYRSWTGPDIFVLVDNEHEVEAWAGGSMGFGKPLAM
ncbi:type VII secretion protein EccCa/type VII secretion protein EccCb [Mycobacteroides abscessus subsp. abscessus]|nr:type VII secretion protein EccCa/type VII secretion protein EccCb [Mycobacteroides abscessus subsp. abscessus]